MPHEITVDTLVTEIPMEYTADFKYLTEVDIYYNFKGSIYVGTLRPLRRRAPSKLSTQHK